MPKIITVTNQKGGVGKTTTAINLSSCLTHYNKKVLVLDMDPQGNCSQALSIDPTLSRKTMYEILLGVISIKKAIRKTSVNSLYIIPSNLTLAMAESTLTKENRSSNHILKDVLSSSDLRLFDYIIIDCPPSLGFLSLNSIIAADEVLVPVQCELFALDALSQLFATIANVQASDNRDLKILGILITMYDPRLKITQDIASEIRTRFKSYVFTTSIKRNISIVESIREGLPVNLYKPTSAGSLSYLALAREVIERDER